jgi:ribonuclease J
VTTLGQTVRFLPLGGLGEIGMNCFALEQRGEILVVDCGAAFPDDDLGVDVIVPDFRFLIERQKDIVGLFITHGHEDHIGAVPHLLRRLSREVPVFAPAHASALIAAKLHGHGISVNSLHVVEPRQSYELGTFLVEPIHVAHSIIGATALAFRTDAGLVVHTADFDLDNEQPAGAPTDTTRLQELGKEGVRLLLSDSTNIDSPERGASEGDVGRALAEIVSKAEHSVFVGMFSSNAHRLLALGEIAQETGRKLCLLGRSLRRHFEVAEALGALHFPSNLLLRPEDVAELPRERTLIIAGGSQGEGASALRKLSQGAHPQVGLHPGDTVVLSSRIIPGNEKAVYSMINDFSRLGARVITRHEDPRIHTSGHASRAELAQMIQWTRPRAFVPVHGTLRHMKSHQALATELGIFESMVVENGTALDIHRDAPLEVGARYAAGQVRIAFGGEEISSQVRRRRGELARRGVIFASIVLDEEGRLLGRPGVSTRGVAGIDDDEGALSVLQSAVRKALEDCPPGKMITIEQSVARALKKAAEEMCSERPLVEVHVTSKNV